RLQGRSGNALQYLGNVEVLVGVKEMSDPVLIAEPPLHPQHPLWSVLLVEALLWLVRFAHERNRGNSAPSSVLRALAQVQMVKRPVRLDAERILSQQEALLRDRLIVSPRSLVELGQNLPILEVLGLGRGRHLESIDRPVIVTDAVTIDES